MSFYLDRLGVKMARQKAKEQAPPPATTDLGAAIESLIQQQVAEQLVEATKHVAPVNPRVPEHRRAFTDTAEQHEFPPPPPATAAPKDLTVSLQRDAAGKPIFAMVGPVKFEIQRNSEGRVVRMVQVDEAPVLPQPPVPYKAAARKYKPGEPR